MTCYTVYLYDKDNDDYSQGYVCRTEEEARTVAEALQSLIKQDMIINRDMYNEPYDWVEIIKYSNDNTVPTGEKIAVYPEDYGKD